MAAPGRAFLFGGLGAYRLYLGFRVSGGLGFVGFRVPGFRVPGFRV